MKCVRTCVRVRMRTLPGERARVPLSVHNVHVLLVLYIEHDNWKYLITALFQPGRAEIGRWARARALLKVNPLG